MKEIKLGNIYGEHNGSDFAGNVWDKDGIIVAMRGRNPENPSDRRAGIELEQRLEPNTEGIANTITTVEKDNMVLETCKVEHIGDMGCHQTDEVYSSDGLSRCIKATDYKNPERIVDAKCLRMVRTEEGKELRKAYEAREIKHGFNEYREAEPRPDDCANTLTSVNKDNNIIETKKIKIRQATKDGFVECEIGGVCDLNYVSSDTRRGRVQDDGQVCPTLATENIPYLIELGDPDFYNFLYEINGAIYLIRIRKLIPLECWRLMDFEDEDFFKAETVVSNTQLYKQAGNSIVRNVLVAVFGQMIEGKENVYKEVS